VGGCGGAGGGGDNSTKVPKAWKNLGRQYGGQVPFKIPS